MPYSAVILAGGRSSRMGRDKVWLEVEGRPLITRQVALVRRLRPAELFISAASADRFAALGCPVLTDQFRGQGPLAGIERALAEMRFPLLLVLAVDIPFMKAAVLRKLAHNCRPGVGAVPVLEERLEPLAAFYPKTALPTARAFLADGFNSATHFAEWLLRIGLANRVPLPASLRKCFTNWNTPADCACASKGGRLRAKS